MPLRASTPTIPMPIPAYSELSEVALHPPSPERSSTPFPADVTTERFEYPFPTPQTATQVQTPPFSVSQAFPTTSLLPSPSSPWPSPSSSSLPHGPPRTYAAVHGHGFSPRSGPNTPPVNGTGHAHAHRLGHAHTNPVQLCALACVNAPIPPSLAGKRGMLELRISSLDSKRTETTSGDRA